MSAVRLDPNEMLRAKAMLLLRRERDVYELQRERARSEAWLAAFDELSRELGSTTIAALFDTWTSLLVDVMGFQIASIYGLSSDPCRVTLLAGRAHVPLLRTLDFLPADLDFLEKNPSGCFRRGATSNLCKFAEQVDFETFLWLSQRPRGQNLLLVAGFTALAGLGHRFRDRDLDHFCLFGAHLRALLDHAVLINELDRERADLKESNRHLDDSLRQLREVQLSLVQQRAVMLEVSRRAGMADVATGVLHNVGNVLNSINISVQVTAERLNGLRTGGLGRVIELLGLPEASGASAPHTEKIITYLRQLLSYLDAEKTALVAEVASMQQHIDHIKHVIGRQQDYAQSIGVYESCDIRQVVDDALALAADSFKRYDIEVLRTFDDVPVAQLDRHKVLQIMVNLISNAVCAVRMHKAISCRRIHASVQSASATRLQVTISDNGVGIASHHLPRLFTHGFTTKESGHGIGLHTSAIAAKEIGGELSCSSDGVNQGATFVLELPIVGARGLEVSE
jgi:two-component system, NtrC family, sensor kinase